MPFLMQFIYWIIGFVLGSALKRILLGAGIALFSAQFIQGIIDFYINNALSGMQSSVSTAVYFLGLSGADVAISILIGALMAKAAMNAMQLGFTKVTR